MTIQDISNPPRRSQTLAMAILMSTLVGSIAHAQTSARYSLGTGVIELDVPSDLWAMMLWDTGDYNYDGYIDMLVAGRYEYDDAFIVLGQSNGEFLTSAPYFIPVSYTALAAGDIDHDGIVDVLTRNSDDNLVYRHFGDGSTTSDAIPNLVYQDSNFSDTFSSMIMADDIDGDGATDFVFNTTTQNIFIRWSSRDQASPYEQISIPELNTDCMIYRLMDFNGDGHIDILAFAKDSAQFILIEGTGTNTMGTTRIITQTHPRISLGDRPLFGHFDENPAADLVVHDFPAGTAEIILNFTNTSPTHIDITPGERIIPIGIVGDLDNSGQIDIVVMRTDILPPALAVDTQGALLSDPLSENSTLTPMVIGDPIENSTISSYVLPRLDIIDIDADNDNDLVWFGNLNYRSVQVTLNQNEIPNSPSFGPTYIPGKPIQLHILAVDLNNDGTEEAIVTGGSNTQIYDLSNGSSTRLIATAGAFMSSVGDMNHDNLKDLVITGIDEYIRVYPIHADGSFGAPEFYTYPNAQLFYTSVIADFDQDGIDDVAATDYQTGSTHILRGRSGTTLEAWGLIDGFTNADVMKPAVIDFNQDGYPDIAIGDQHNDLIKFYLNNRDGTFTNTYSFSSEGTYWLIAQDIDQDGITDLISTSFRWGAPNGVCIIHFMDEMGQPSQTVELYHAGAVPEVIAADFAGNSLPDIATASMRTIGRLSRPQTVWEQTSPRVFKLSGLLPIGNITGLDASDINNDGAMDLITIGRDDDSVLINWGTPKPCLADLTNDGLLNFFDISAFLSAFADADLAADFNSDGLLNFFDISAFMIEFADGCP